MTLFPAQQTCLDTAKRLHVQATLDLIADTIRHGHWIPSRNRYLRDCIGRLTNDRTPPHKVKPTHVNEYIAASAVPHCIDGWAYVGRAFSSFLRGDTDTARHLGYYAELRAAMSLLAGEGIGVFSKEHYVISARRKCSPMPPARNARDPARSVGPGTHQFVWDALQYWATKDKARDLVFGMIRVGDKPLIEWLDSFGAPPSTLSLIAGDWLKQWGLDLQEISVDQRARNQSSYRPTLFSSPRPDSATNAVRFIIGAWESCEPVGDSRFSKLDRHLLRASLSKAFEATVGRSPKQSPAIYRTRIEAMISSLAPGMRTADDWQKFLTFEQEGDKLGLITEGQGKLSIFDAGNERQVMSRAVLLLRLATGSCEKLLRDSTSLSMSDFRSAWTQMGGDHGILDPVSPPDAAADIWSQIDESLGQLSDWLQVQGNGGSYFKLLEEQGNAIHQVCNCEAIGLWGLGL